MPKRKERRKEGRKERMKGEREGGREGGREEVRWDLLFLAYPDAFSGSRELRTVEIAGGLFGTQI
jgi:hypothetical protein